MTQRHLIIVNPQAMHGETARLTPVIEKLLGSIPHDMVETTSPGHAVELAANATGYDVVVAVGGDGTVHEVLNGLMRHPAETRPALGVLPTGSGNDTCRTLGIPFDVSEATLILATGEQVRFDVGECNGIYFNNSFAAGLDAKVTAKAVEYKVTKHRSGMWLYLSALLHVLVNDLAPFEISLGFDGETPSPATTLIIAVTNGPTYGGGFKITPDAVFDDGLFDICRIDNIPKAEAFMRLPFVVIGKHTKMKPVHMSRGKRLTVVSQTPFEGQIDGEVMIESAYDIQIFPAAMTVIVPAEKAARP